MAFNTTSFLAGVGTVVVVLSTGFAGGYMVANPNAPAPPNRLQRLAADNQGSKVAAPVTAAAPKPEIVADAAAQPAAPVPQPAAAPADTRPEVKANVITEAKADIQPPTALPPSVKPVETNAPANRPDVAAVQPVGPDRNGAGRAQPADSRPQDRPQDSKSAEAKAADRKRSDAKKFAEQQRRQRELEVATVAVRRIIHERPPQAVMVDDDQPEASAPATPHFSLFGQE